MLKATTHHITLGAILVLFAAGLAACDKKPDQSAPKPDQPATTGDNPTGAGHGGKIIALGQSVIGPFNVKATRDVGPITPGGDAPIDVWVDPAPDAAQPPAKVAAVRFWIGAQDASGSVKARALIEDPKEPNRWHTHTELPDPLPTDAKLWVEIESEGGKTASGSFDLKP